LLFVARNGFASSLYERIGWHLAIIQSGAALEILHSLTGLVRTPVTTTTVQVCSRLLLVWGICYLLDIPEVNDHWAFYTMTLSWSVTEAVRYLFFTLNLVGVRFFPILWCRYTLFLVLYPVGAGSEAVLIYRALDGARALSPIYSFILTGIILTYPPGLMVMYTHMIGQRKKNLTTSGQQDKNQ